MKRILPVLAVLLCAVPLLAVEPSTDFFFKDGDRILFLGDSITEQYQYSSTIELYLTTRDPKWRLTFLNAGIGGDTASGGKGRFASHVLAEKPTAVTIDFGMNDGGYGKFNPQSAENFLKNTEAMLQAAKAAGVRVALISPNAVDWRKQPGRKEYLETQKQFYAGLKDLAAKYHDAFVDQYAVTRAALEKMEADNAIQVQPFPDTVHTSSAGGLLMAHAILVGLKAPALVSSVAIDAGAGKAQTQACKVDRLEATTKGVAFDRTDDALPLPIANDWQSLLPYVNDLKDLNNYSLQVTGLAEGKYQLSIDGKEVAGYTADQLARGVNLGNLPSGPIYDQGKKVFDAINQKNNIVHGRFRGVVMFNAPDWLADVVKDRKPLELSKRMDQINERQAEIFKLVQPTTHRFELKAGQ
jgi:lysophospholipase L1-like esterase